MEKIVFFADYGKMKIPSFLNSPYSFAKKFSLSLDYSLKVIPQLSGLIKKNKLKIIAFDNESLSFFKKKGFNPSPIREYDSPNIEKNADKEAMRIIKSLPSQNKKFSDSSTYSGISLWSIQELDSWGSFFQKAVKTLNLIETIIKKEKPKIIIILDKESFNNKLAYEFCIKKNIKIHIIKKSKSETHSKIKDILKLFVAKSISFHGIKKFPIAKNIKEGIKKNNKKKVLLLRDISDPKNITLHLYKHMINRYDVLLTSIEDGSRMYSKINYSNFRDYIDKDCSLSFNREKKKFSSYWKILKKNKNFTETLNFKGMNLWPVLYDLFLFYYNVRFSELVLLIEIINNILRNEKPDLVMLFDDIGVFGKTAAYFCKLNKIPCLTLQHGIIGELPIEYSVSDEFAAYGNVAKKIMIKNGMNPKKITITGNPRFDILINKKYSKNEFYNKFKIPKDYKLVVLATSTYFLGELNKTIVTSMMDCIKKLKKVKLLIKLHPSEGNVSLYKQLARKAGLDAIILEKYDIYDILHASDVVVVSSSTVGLEAMVFGKPLINVNLTNAEEHIPYSKSKAAIGVFNISDLYGALYDSLYNKKVLKNLELNGKRFINKHAFKVDGKSTKRILSLINNMLGEK